MPSTSSKPVQYQPEQLFHHAFLFPQQHKLGVFSHSKGSGAGRSSQIRLAQGWEPGSGEGSPFPRQSLGAAKSPRQRLGRGSQARFPGRGSQARFPRGSQEQVPKQGFPQEVPNPRDKFPSKVPKQCSQEEVPSKVSKQGSQEQIPKQGFPARGSQARFPGRGYQEEGFQEEVPRQGSQEVPGKVPRFPSKGSQARVPSKRFPSKGSQEDVLRKRFPSKGSQEEVSRNRFPSKVPKNRFCKHGFQEPFSRFPGTVSQEHVFPKQNKIPRTGFQASVSRKRFRGRGVQARFPASWFPSNVFRKRLGSQTHVSQEQVHK